MAKYPYVNAANRYARDVVAGRIVVCEYIKQACQRHLDDLAKSKSDPKYPYKFDNELAEKACRFIQLLPHVKGKWKRNPPKERRISLEPWQCFFECNIYGWIRKKNKMRRFRTAALYVPRKNGKSIIAAGNALYLFAGEKEPGSEVYCGATTEKQAWEVFKPALLMARQLPDMRRTLGIELHAKKMTRIDGSVFEPVIGNPGDGSSPHGAIIDEFHEHPDSSLYDTMETGMGAREQPLILVITTAGTDPHGPAKSLWDECVRMLSGAEPNEELFSMIFTLDKGDDLYDPRSLAKANPNMGVSVEIDFLLSAQQRAKRNARHQTKYLIKHLNIWTSASHAFFNMEHWRKASDLTLKLDDFKGCDCWFSLDLASKLDICSFIQCFTRLGSDGQLHYYLFSRHYLPEDTVNDDDNKNFEKYQTFIRTEWENSGGKALIDTDGAEIDFNEIAADVLELSEQFRPREIPHDPWNSAQLAQQLISNGYQAVAIPQTTAHLSPAMREFESALSAGRVHHDGNPVLTWMISNVVAKEDANENVFPRKDKKENKIDGAVASIMAIGRAMLNKGSSSPYDDPDFDPEDAWLDD